MTLRQEVWKWEGSPAGFIKSSEPVPAVKAAIEIFGSIKDSYIFSIPLGQSPGEVELREVMEKAERPLQIYSRYN
jgi:hypothetical protein